MLALRRSARWSKRRIARSERRFVLVNHDALGALVIAPDGDLDLCGLEPFRACLDAAVECGSPIVVVDLERVTLLSAGH